METVYRQRTGNFIKPKTNSPVIPKRSGKLTDLIKMTDDLLEKQYDFVKPIYKVVEYYESKQPRRSRSSKPQLHRDDRVLYKETIYYEALMTKSPILLK
ncbi:hypothetical protein [Bacillus wiedmannii]|uniref:hypothetical protein n=1 Tax=Bacillus wiedmannii TaxID=1890302 RepID=UPI000BF0266D|nr:hypothetical protein [Bacillus wiedmannii]PEJ92659.1 hypothetical protein CN690_29290 [Bacillus wiedmannii]PEZ66398.1 hypothetical protein CN372_04840 [Bacillus anthracis]